MHPEGKMPVLRAAGAWLTDIDDTLVDSGALPGAQALRSFGAFVRRLSDHGVIWVGMSGVSLAKIRERLFDRVRGSLRASILYYSGDGSQKYVLVPDDGGWIEDRSFTRTLSDVQTVALLGPGRFEGALAANGVADNEARSRGQLASTAWRKWSASARANARAGRDGDPGRPILDVLEERLSSYGFSPKEAALYYRGGSISWMILGDRSADVYRQPKAARARSALIRLARRELAVRGNLSELGEPVVLPFPGARGIKFVLEANSKLRAVRDLMATGGLPPRKLIYAGNELYRGGNDNMLRAVRGMTLLSVGRRVDGGSAYVVDGRLSAADGRTDGEDGRSAVERGAGGDRRGEGVIAMEAWMQWVAQRLERGITWVDLLRAVRCGDGPSAEQADSVRPCPSG